MKISTPIALVILASTTFAIPPPPQTTPSANPKPLPHPGGPAPPSHQAQPSYPPGARPTRVAGRDVVDLEARGSSHPPPPHIEHSTRPKNPSDPNPYYLSDPLATKKASGGSTDLEARGELRGKPSSPGEHPSSEKPHAGGFLNAPRPGRPWGGPPGAASASTDLETRGNDKHGVVCDPSKKYGNNFVPFDILFPRFDQFCNGLGRTVVKKGTTKDGLVGPQHDQTYVKYQADHADWSVDPESCYSYLTGIASSCTGHGLRDASAGGSHYWQAYGSLYFETRN